MSLDMFSHIYLIYWFHKTMKPNLVVTPYLDSQQHGVFSTRAPSRPNPIGISVVELIEIDKETIIFRGADMLDGTPLLDIKPYVPVFDCRVNATEGWLKGKISFREEDKVADERFEIS
jgi:tRNA-Thr(GGU) m(6)t(6)A37 methyltransferase TsaA